MTIRFKFSVSVHDLTCDWIKEISSGTILRDVTDQISGDSENISLTVGPDRSVDASWDAVSLTR